MIAETLRKDKSSILLIYTGGTIGMKEDPEIQADSTVIEKPVTKALPIALEEMPIKK